MAPPKSTAETWLRLARVTLPPAEVVQAFQLNPFYRKYVDLMGIPIVSSEAVRDAALLEAGYLAHRMLQGRSEIAPEMASRKVRIAVMAVAEFTTDIPEHSDLTPDWDRRARGLGATQWRPASSCAEENLLECPGDPYRGESILVHEFAHSIHLMALRHLDPTFDGRLESTYQAAMSAGLWSDTYAANNSQEYWSEGVQSYFGCNPRVPNASHNDINTRAELRRYDPGLCRLIRQQLGGGRWRYVPPTRRTHQRHLRRLDRTTLPTFTWPP
jgi:hypothetical protein